MSPQVLKRIALTLGLLLVAWGALVFARRLRRDDSGTLALPRIAPDQVTEVAFRKGQDTVVLSRHGDGWSANGFPGSTPSVRALLEALTDTSLRSEIVARSPGTHQRLGVDSTGRRLTLRAGDSTRLDLRIGNRGPDFEGFYVRSEGADEVYLLRGRFAEFLSRDLTEWREKQIAAIPPDSVARVEVRRGGSGWTMTRQGTTWQLKQGTADSAKAARFLAHFDGLRASGFPDPEQLDSIRFDQPERAVQLFGASGELLLGLVFDSTSGGAFWVRGDSGGPVYRLDMRLADLATPAESAVQK